MVDVILGLQWGDEGKGKIVDYFAPNYDVIARFQGGPNAGHTLYIDGKKVVLHQIPSGIFHQNCVNLIGNGVVLDPVTLKRECDIVSKMGIDVKKNLFISQRTNIIVPTHRALDKASEAQKGDSKIGSTLKGIGPAYMDKTGRNALRVGDLLDKSFTTQYIKLRLKHQKLLDNFHFNEDITAWEEEFFEALEFLKTLNIVNGEYFINDKRHNPNGPAYIEYNKKGNITKKEWYIYGNKIDGREFKSILKNIPKEDLKAYILITYS
ncbi:MAG: adenylosuccinate synthetase, partial [Bacteroidetes bacterium]|nr:adenylosuccinate synthetase [Bacteroidota bacterium]